MMKDDNALEEVWSWKKAIHSETKGMSVKEFVEFAQKRAQAFREKYSIRSAATDKPERR